MGEHEVTFFAGISCDTRGCEQKIEPPLMSHCGPKRIFWGEAAAKGWTLWVGRGRRVYCPQHKPRAGHRMSDVTPAPVSSSGEAPVGLAP